MNRFLIACFAATGYCGLATAASATSMQNAMQPVVMKATSLQQNDDMPYVLAKLHGEIQMLQTEVQTLGGLESRAPGDPIYVFSAEPTPNPDGAPVPSGG